MTEGRAGHETFGIYQREHPPCALGCAPPFDGHSAPAPPEGYEPRTLERVHFQYHCYQGEASADAKAWHRTDQHAVILRVDRGANELPDGEAEDMYRLRFDDGHEHDVFRDEVFPVTSGGRGSAG